MYSVYCMYGISYRSHRTVELKSRVSLMSPPFWVSTQRDIFWKAMTTFNQHFKKCANTCVQYKSYDSTAHILQSYATRKFVQYHCGIIWQLLGSTPKAEVWGGGYFRVLGLPLTVFRVLICIGRLDSYLIAPWIRIRGPHSAPFLIITSLGADFYFIM